MVHRVPHVRDRLSARAWVRSSNVLEKGKVGISPYEIGPHDLGNGRFQYEFLPVPTALCDLCADRVEKGKLPTCVKHCQAGCMQYGSVEELSKKMTSKKMVLFV